jgi:hypothetical protein
MNRTMVLDISASGIKGGWPTLRWDRTFLSHLAGELTRSVRDHFPSNKLFMKVKGAAGFFLALFISWICSSLAFWAVLKTTRQVWTHSEHGAGKR